MKARALLLPPLLGAALVLAACQQDTASPVAGERVSTDAGSGDPWADKRVDGLIHLQWEDLIPSGVDPETLYDKVSRKSLMTEENEDPISQVVLAVTKVISARSPVVESLNGRRIQLDGLVVPLEGDGEKLSEFLLVPYFGACVHVPPPPANQIVYVKTAQHPVDAVQLFGSVSVTGRLLTVYSHSEEGDTGYTLEAERVEPYE
jgi:hypothetical protein